MITLETRPAPADATSGFVPAYVRLLESGELERRVGVAWRHLEDCDLCARYCQVNRDDR